MNDTGDGAERRMHPWSWLFVLAQQVRPFVVPLLALLFFGARGNDGDLWAYAAPVIAVAALGLASAWQCLSFRYRIGADRITVRSGLLHRNLREMAKANFKVVDRAGGDVGSQALAQAQMKAADILEGLAERNLSLNKAPASLIQELRDARKLIAKTYTIENAINEGAGNVSAQKLAQALNRGAPLESGLLTAAKFGNAFSKSAQSPEKMGAVPPFTMTDLVTGALGGTVNPALAGLALVRPAARSVVLSKMMQDSLANPSYAAPTALRAADAVAWSPALRALLPGLGAAGVIPQVQQ